MTAYDIGFAVVGARHDHAAGMTARLLEAGARLRGFFEDVEGTARVDWLSSDGLGTWGDGRLLVLGTQGHLEVRKNIDLAGRAGGEHLFLVNKGGVRHLPCAEQETPFARQLLRDLCEGGETALPQTHSFAACELALRAQEMARMAREEAA